MIPVARLLVLLTVAILPATAALAVEPRAAAALAPVLPAVVRVDVVKRAQPAAGPNELFGRLGLDKPDPRNESGSGFVLDPSAGLVAAMEFVVRDAEKITLQLHDGRVVFAELVAADEETQLALLRAPVTDLPAVAWADSGGLRPGDAVFAAGHHFDLGLLVTGGILSGRIGPSDRTSGREYLAVDAPVMPGSAGGPMFEASGRVVGVIVGNFGTSMDRSLGMAVPASIARPILEHLRDGPVTRGSLGVTPGEAVAGDDGPPGVAVAEVLPGSGAATAGLEPGDVILSFGDREIADAADLRREVAATAPGSVVAITYTRRGSRQVATVTLDGR